MQTSTSSASRDESRNSTGTVGVHYKIGAAFFLLFFPPLFLTLSLLLAGRKIGEGSFGVIFEGT